MDDTLEEVVRATTRQGSGKPPRRLELWLPILIVVIDQATKAMVRAVVPVQNSVTVIPGFMDFTHVLNSGAAFGILNGTEFPFKTVLIAAIATAARLGLALIIGGAAGNLIDRVVAGSVVDFVDVYWRSHHFWAFNVADSAISVGVAIMVLDMLGIGHGIGTNVSK